MLEPSYLNRMIAGYVASMLWSSTDESDEYGGVPLDESNEWGDIADETMIQIEEDCKDFIEINWNDLQDIEPEMAGHDFWLTRNNHGAGFWDRGLGEIGKRLTESAHVFGEVYLYIGDDKLLYLT